MSETNFNGFEIAIVGMACRFPDAVTPTAFWDNVFAGKDSIRPLNEEELEAAGQASCVDQTDFVNSGSFLDDITQFDSQLFGYSARESDYIDPQHRVFLHVAWEALEQSGYIVQKPDNRVGVFAGSSASSYLLHHYRNAADEAEEHLRNLSFENNHDLLATRVAYKLNLTGPAITIGSACSTSLVVVHQACQSLIAGECDTAIAGASRISVPQKCGYFYAQGGILSRDGKCRAFDAKASGTISGSGAGAIVLRRLEDALSDQDNIIAVIKGSAINNDGDRKVGFSAPSVEGQKNVIVSALHNADIDARQVTYVEAHGTATELGDPIEIQALSDAFRHFTDEEHFCALGSVKSNIGHLDAAAGMASILKVCGMLTRQQLPPALHYESPNPNIDLDNSPFFIPQQVKPWQSEGLRTAGISAFGIGGTNAHLILQECIQPSQELKETQEKQSLFVFSARSKNALDDALDRFKDWLQINPDADLGVVEATLAKHRKVMPFRAAFTASSIASAISTLHDKTSIHILQGKAASMDQKTVFVCTGQGAQYPQMGLDLYNSEPIFTQTIDECAQYIDDHKAGFDLKQLLFTQHSSSGNELSLYNTRFAQPALFCFEYAMSQLLISKGITPKALIGHSLGEYVAATLSGVFNLEDAIKVVCERGRLMSELEAGAMIAVSAPYEQISHLVKDGVDVAAHNTDHSVVLSGPISEIEPTHEGLVALGITVTRLHTSHAFHSTMIETCLDEFADLLATVKFSQPSIPFISNLTGTFALAEQVMTPEYWCQQARKPVMFAQGISALEAQSDQHFLEIGPGRSLTGLIAMITGNSSRATALVRDVKSTIPDRDAFYRGLAQFWTNGGQIDWQTYFPSNIKPLLSLPTYAFDNHQHDLQAKTFDTAKVSTNIGRQLFSDWFYRASWKTEAALPVTLTLSDKRILLMTQSDIAEGHLIDECSRQNQLYVARSVGRFSVDEQGFTFSQFVFEHYVEIFQRLAQKGALPDVIIHHLSCDLDADKDVVLESKFFSFLYIAKAWQQVVGEKSVVLCALSSNMCFTGYGDQVIPEESLILGPCKTISKEIPTIRTFYIDLAEENATGSFITRQQANLVCREIAAQSSHYIGACNEGVALRGAQRLCEYYEKVSLPIEDRAWPLREQGVYLVTGGNGGIGATIARYLAQVCDAHVIIVSRKAEDQSLSSHAHNITYLSVDVTDLGRLTDLVEGALHALNPNKLHLNGVFHCAGIADGGLIQMRSKQQSTEVFAAKLQGSDNLGQIADQYHCDFIFNCSSLSAWIGPVGQVAYCSANNYQQAIADSGRFSTPTFTVAWDAWRQVGMAVDSLAKQGLSSDVIEHGITPEEGIRVVIATLNSGLTNILVSTRSLDSIKNITSQDDLSNDRQANDDQNALHPRPDLSMSYVAPETDIQATLCEIWSQRLGVGPIGIHDDFFELYGHSLLAVQIAADIKKRLTFPLPGGALYDYPTVYSLAQFIEEDSTQTETDDDRITLEI